MEIWRRDDGVEFESEEDAYDDSYTYCEDVFEDAFLNAFGSGKLLKWAMKQDGFWETFDNEITQVREYLFDEYYTHWSQEELDEEAETEELIAAIRECSKSMPEQRFALDPWGNLYAANPTE